MSEIIHCPDAHVTMWQALGDRDYRHAYVEGHVGDFLASQIHALRASQGWTQAELAQRAEVSQPQISGWEKSCEGVRLTSLHKVAEAFDIALVAKFVPFSQFAKEAIDARADVQILSFEDESPEAVKFNAVRTAPPEARVSKRKSSGGETGYLRFSPELGSGLITIMPAL